jgi:hypothetical protein
MELLGTIGVATMLAILFVNDLINLNIPSKQSGTGGRFLLFGPPKEKPQPEPKRQPLYAEKDARKNLEGPHRTPFLKACHYTIERLIYYINNPTENHGFLEHEDTYVLDVLQQYKHSYKNSRNMPSIDVSDVYELREMVLDALVFGAKDPCLGTHIWRRLFLVLRAAHRPEPLLEPMRRFLLHEDWPEEGFDYYSKEPPWPNQYYVRGTD